MSLIRSLGIRSKSVRRPAPVRPGQVAGVTIVPGLICEKCGGPMFYARTPCFMKRLGWKTVGRCLRCGHLQGVKKGGKKNALSE